MHLLPGIVILIFSAKLLHTEKCTNAIEEVGECISLFSCPVLLDALGTKAQQHIKFYRQSICGGSPELPMVCCGWTSSFRDANRTKYLNLLPTRQTCGWQQSDGYVHDENITVLSEAPWLALIKVEYNKSLPNLNSSAVEERSYGCGGSLINERYVLTTTYCITNKRYILTGVLLGEFNVENSMDCMLYKGQNECSSKVEHFGIEKAIVHHAYRYRDYKTRGNDIGLIRLNGTVEYTDYIRPICLPLPGINRAEVNDILTTYIWNFLTYSDQAQLRPTKSKFTTALVESKYGACTTDVSDTGEQICTRRHGANKKPGPCSVGNYGSPVVFSTRKQWHVEGLVGYLHGCNEDNEVMVYVNVTYHLDWILRHLEPEEVKHIQ